VIPSTPNLLNLMPVRLMGWSEMPPARDSQVHPLDMMSVRDHPDLCCLYDFA
jgi:hypothetical protein